MENITLESIIIGCKNNDRKSQNELYNLYVGVAYNVVLKYYKDKSTADDIVHTAFLKILNNIDKYKFEGSFEGWVRRIVKNYTIDVIRKKTIHIEFTDNISSVIDNFGEIECQSVKEDMVEDIIKLSDELSESYSLVFKMYFFEKMSHKSIAKKLGINEGTSKSNLHKAKFKIKEKLKNKVYE